MNKKQAETYHGIKELNQVMKNNNISLRYLVVKDFLGAYNLKTTDDTPNLPERIRLKDLANAVLNHYFECKKIRIAIEAGKFN